MKGKREADQGAWDICKKTVIAKMKQHIAEKILEKVHSILLIFRF